MDKNKYVDDLIERVLLKDAVMAKQREPYQEMTDKEFYDMFQVLFGKKG